MITMKQIEAIFWVARLGSFDEAADHLNTTQSAISKRIQELESRYGQALFDRSRRSAQLTPLGEEVVALASGLLGQRDIILQRLESPENLQRKLRLGVTELTALTWLPDLISGIRERYPQVEIIPEIDLSSVLYERLTSNSIDLIIVPDIFQDNRFNSQNLSGVENAWMCAPSLVGERSHLTLQELAGRTLILQGALSGMGIAYGQWFKARGVNITKSITCNNLLGQIGLAVSGLATAYLPLHCLQHLLDKNLLQQLTVTPPLPKITYKAIHRGVEGDRFMTDILEITTRTCDFSKWIIH
jgi:DNA-binding transcriptional LysR family regulator